MRCGKNGVTLDKLREENSNTCYACPTHVMQSSIHASMQWMHLLHTHLDFTDTMQDAPSHTIMIEANMRNSDHQKANKN